MGSASHTAKMGPLDTGTSCPQAPDVHASVSSIARRCSPTGVALPASSHSFFTHNLKPQLVALGGWSLGHMPAPWLKIRLGKQLFWLLPGSVSALGFSRQKLTLVDLSGGNLLQER